MKQAFQYYWFQPVRRAGPHIFTGKPLIGVSFWICDQGKPQIIETMSPFFRSENFRIFSNSIFKAYFEWNNQVYLIYFFPQNAPFDCNLQRGNCPMTTILEFPGTEFPLVASPKRGGKNIIFLKTVLVLMATCTTFRCLVCRYTIYYRILRNTRFRRGWDCREFTQGRRRRLRKRHLKSEFALPQT